MAYTRTGYANFAAFPATGSANVIYVDLSNGNEYLWSTSAYVAYTGTQAGVRLGYQDAAWFAANPNFLLGKGQLVYLLQTGQYKIGDGVTALSALTYHGGAVTSSLTIGTTTITSGTNTRILYNNNGVLGEYAVTGTGTTAVLSLAPTTVNHIITPSSNAGLEYALKLTDDGSGINNADLLIDSIYNSRVILRNSNTSTRWYLHNQVGIGGSGVDSFGIGTSFNNGLNFFAIKSNGNAVFTGSVIIGGIAGSPTARLHLPAGTATANTAPLKLTSGTNLTTPEAGAVEFDGTNFYATPSSTRKTIAFTDINCGTPIFKAPFIGTQIGHCPNHGGQNPTTTLSYTTDQVTCVPFILSESLTITDLKFIVWNNVATKYAAVGIYEWNESTNNAGTLIVTSGQVSCATTGVKTYNFTAITLQAHKKYLLAFINNDSTIRIYSTSYGGDSYLPINDTNGNKYSVLTKTISSGWTGLPSSLTLDSGRVQVSPIIGMS